MKKTNLTLTILFLFFITSSIGMKNSSEPALKPGTYGVCNCGEELSQSTKIELTVNEDHTFHYFDNSNRKELIDLNGKWVMDDKTIKLTDYQSTVKIHDKWTIDRNTNCIRSRKGLEFTRLCHLKNCK